MQPDVDLGVWKAIAVALSCLISALGVFLPIFYAEWFFVRNGIRHFNCYIAGVLFGTAITQMLTEAEHNQMTWMTKFPIQHFVMGMCFIFIMALQWIIESVKRNETMASALKRMMQNQNVEILTSDFSVETPAKIEDTNHEPPKLSVLGFIFVFESMLTGSAIGLQRKSAGVIILALSSAATDWIQAILFAMAMALKSKNSTEYRRTAFRYAFVYWLGSVLCLSFWIALYSFLPYTPKLEMFGSIAMACLAGQYLYLSCIDILSKEIHGSDIHGGYPSVKHLFKRLGQFLFGFLTVTSLVYFEHY